MNICDEIKRAHDLLQRLEITATQRNMETLIYTLSVLKKAHEQLTKERNDEDGGH